MRSKNTITLLKLSLMILFLSLAAITNAGMDTLVHHYSNSFAVHYKLDRQFWDPSISWKNKYANENPEEGRTKINLLLFKIDKPVIFTDGWHMLKAIMLAFIFLSSVIWIPVNWWQKLLIFIGLTLLWSVVFGIIYR